MHHGSHKNPSLAALMRPALAGAEATKWSYGLYEGTLHETVYAVLHDQRSMSLRDSPIPILPRHGGSASSGSRGPIVQSSKRC